MTFAGIAADKTTGNPRIGQQLVGEQGIALTDGALFFEPLIGGSARQTVIIRDVIYDIVMNVANGFVVGCTLSMRAGDWWHPGSRHPARLWAPDRLW
jgi:hypothetical protein